MRATNVRRHPRAGFAPHPGINFSNMPVGGDVAGLAFAIGSIVVILLGIPELRPFFGAAVGGGLLLGVVLARRRAPGRHHEGRRRQ